MATTHFRINSFNLRLETYCLPFLENATRIFFRNRNSHFGVVVFFQPILSLDFNMFFIFWFFLDLFWSALQKMLGTKRTFSKKFCTTELFSVQLDNVSWGKVRNNVYHVIWSKLYLKLFFAFLKTINAFKKQLKKYLFENILDAFSGNGFIACFLILQFYKSKW